ncbi:unnamed protein product [Blepharisma stoltei]|uniref:Uncharacterized protein n=1 Tax=Blepharisma stoltei TaxID=1481888 RepID=A0AAU9IPD2_9CILI|nr:unnamed protein product [Blepharisma stoltei]
MELSVARRPNTCSIGTVIPICANFFRFNTASNVDFMQKYSVAFEPDIPASLFKQRERLLRKVSSQLIPQIGKYVFANTAVYCIHSASQGLSGSITVTTNFDNVDYSITLTPTGRVESTEEKKHFFNRFFNSVQGKLDLIMIGRKFYDPTNSKDLPQHHISIWPGYYTSVGSYAEGCLVNIDISHRCLRTITVYDQIKEIRTRSNNDYAQNSLKLLLNATVLTLYNKKTYKVVDIDFDSTAESTFQDSTGKVQTYKEYYEKRWQKNIEHNEQPLLKATTNKNPNPCYLIPEFCVLTGLTDEMRADFNIMKDMANATKKEPQERLQKSAGLINTVNSNSKTRSEIDQWRISLSPDPVTIEGRVLPMGGIMLANNQTFNIGQSGSFDRESQGAMFEQPPMNNWAILHCENDKRLVDTFISMLQVVIKTYNVACSRPVVISLRSDRWDEWERTLSNPNNNSQLIVCVLPGQRGKSRLYDDLKRYVLAVKPIPVQAVLTGTLKREKGLRSVVNKVMMQMTAKLGGIPWALNQLPYSDVKTMIVGIDAYQKRGQFSILGFCASIDRNFGKYVTVPQVNSKGEQDISKLTDSMYSALLQFKAANNEEFPKRIAIFRDGISEGQKRVVLDREIPMILEAFNRCRNQGLTEDPKLIYTLVNKRTNSRFYQMQGKNISNPPIGTVIDKAVVSDDGYDFYILPARATQGAMTPTHFIVIFDNTGCRCEEIQGLAFKLCFSYYNWSGSIRVPAPCQYAHKLAYLYGERATNQGPPIPHGDWTRSRSLYFL